MTTKPTKHKHTNNERTIFFEMEYFPFEKKKQVLSDSNPGPFPFQA